MIACGALEPARIREWHDRRLLRSTFHVPLYDGKSGTTTLEKSVPAARRRRDSRNFHPSRVTPDVAYPRHSFGGPALPGRLGFGWAPNPAFGTMVWLSASGRTKGGEIKLVSRGASLAVFAI